MSVKSLEADYTKFASTATGHAVAGLVSSAVVAVIGVVLKDPGVVGYLAGGGVGATVVRFVVEVLDGNVANL